MKTFRLNVSYSQISIFDAELEQPFNDWTDEHVAQGFAWRPGSVSFATLNPFGETDVVVAIGKTPPSLLETAVRAIAVPFTVPQHGKVEISTVEAIGGGCEYRLQPGAYELVFVHGVDQVRGQKMWIQLHFDPTPPS